MVARGATEGGVGDKGLGGPLGGGTLRHFAGSPDSAGGRGAFEPRPPSFPRAPPAPHSVAARPYHVPARWPSPPGRIPEDRTPATTPASRVPGMGGRIEATMG